MIPTTQTLTLTSAIRTLNSRDFDAPLVPLTDVQRAELLAQCSWLQNALDRWRAATIHAPIRHTDATAARQLRLAEVAR